MRDREDRNRNDDQIVQEDRPAGDEAPELVEGVAGQRRGAAPLLVQDATLDVGHHREDEEDPGEQVCDRRQPERVAGNDAEREVDRSADGRQPDRKEPERPHAAAAEGERGRQDPAQRKGCAHTRAELAEARHHASWRVAWM